MLKHIVTSPLLHATPFVGKHEPHKTQEGKMWLWCAEYGFSFCCAGIDESFGTFKNGDIVRLEVRINEFLGGKPYPYDEAGQISELADRMLSEMFGHEYGTSEWEESFIEACGLDEDVIESSLESTLPGDLYYCVRRV